LERFMVLAVEPAFVQLFENFFLLGCKLRIVVL
jgi:hypothetical protein